MISLVYLFNILSITAVEGPRRLKQTVKVGTDIETQYKQVASERVDYFMLMF